MKKTHSAFTLVELLIVVLVMGVIAFVTVPSYISSQSKQKLTNSAKDILRMMNEGRNRALAGLAVQGEDIDNDNFVDAEETSLPHAFGVYFSQDADFDNQLNKSKAVLFADEDGDWQLDPAIDTVLEELEFPYTTKLFQLQAQEDVSGAKVRHNSPEAAVFYRVPTGSVLLNIKDAGDNWVSADTMTDLDWVRIDLGMWQMADVDDKITDKAYVRSVVAHSVSDYAYMCSTIEAYNDDSTACNRNAE